MEQRQGRSLVRWVPSRWQLADVLTKPGSEETFRIIMISCFTRFSELSAQQLKTYRDGEKQKMCNISLGADDREHPRASSSS